MHFNDKTKRERILPSHGNFSFALIGQRKTNASCILKKKNKLFITAYLETKFVCPIFFIQHIEFLHLIKKGKIVI